MKGWIDCQSYVVLTRLPACSFSPPGHCYIPSPRTLSFNIMLFTLPPNFFSSSASSFFFLFIQEYFPDPTGLCCVSLESTLCFHCLIINAYHLHCLVIFCSLLGVFQWILSSVTRDPGVSSFISGAPATINMPDKFLGLKYIDY